MALTCQSTTRNTSSGSTRPVWYSATVWKMVSRAAQETIFQTVAEYQTGLVEPDEVFRVVLWHVNAIWGSLSTSHRTETTVSSATGQDRARAGKIGRASW